ncbi:CYTH domain-containing protein [Mucilaginibacter sp.]
MGIEIERKYLVNRSRWQQLDKPEGIHYVQGYIVNSENKTIRIRIAGERSFLTLKTKPITKASRYEFEYEIPLTDGQQMLKLFTVNPVEKIRYRVNHHSHTWEVDEFLKDNEGLIVAELELKDENEFFPLPDWVEREVTDEPRFANASLALRPFKNWP